MRFSWRRQGSQFDFEHLESRILLAGDLVAHWRADDLVADHADGQAITHWRDRVEDRSAAASGFPILVHGAIGGRAVARFDGADGKDAFRVTSTDSPLAGANDYSIVVMFASEQRTVGENQQWYHGTGLVHANSFGFANDWGVTLMPTGQAATGMGDGFGHPTTSLLSESAAMNDGEFHVIVVTRQADRLSMFIDDEPAITVNGASTKSRDLLDLEIGHPLARRGEFDGDIAEIQIYDGALTAARVSEVQAEVSGYYQNSLPMAQDDEYEFLEDGLLFVVAGDGVLANDTDADGDVLTAQIVQQPTHGDLAFRADGSFLYDSNEEFFGVDTFTYQAVDFRPSEPVTVTINVTAVHDPPRGLEDTYKSAPTNVLRVGAATGVLANDVSVEGLPITAVLVDDVSFGQLTLNSDGAFDFDPQGNTGTATFRYRIEDTVVASMPITVSMVINSIPTAVSDAIRMTEDELLSLPSSQGVLANDFDADGDSLQTILLSAPQHVQLALAEDGSIFAVPDADFFGADAFTYQVTDGVDLSSPVTVHLDVIAVNDPPITTADVYFVGNEQTLNVATARGVLSNDADIEKQSLTAEVLRLPAGGQLSLATDGSFTYTARAGFRGRDTFQYQVRDSDGATAEAAVIVFVGQSPLVISEIMAANGTTLLTRTRPTPEDSYTRREAEAPDWIEIQNLSNLPLDLSGYYLSDDPDQARKWQFPIGTGIDANDFLVVFASGLNITDPRLDELEQLHTNFKLDAEGDYLGLASPDAIVMHEFAPQYPAQIAEVSYGLVGERLQYMPTPSPGSAAIGIGLGAIAEPPESTVPSGYFDAEFELRLIANTTGSTIRYTLDGSEPTLANGTNYVDAIKVTATTTLRARAFREDRVPSISATYSYLFLDDVLTQSDEPVGFPLQWGAAGAADYAVDPRIAADTTSQYFDPDLRASLQSHASISIVTDNDHLFDRRTGIYANPQRVGVDWERPVSVEYITPEGSAEIQVNAGLRVQGGASRMPNRPKHNLRLLFKERYGPGKLEFPLFENSAVDRFDTFILRGGNGDSWFHPNATQQRQAQYIRDQWHRDTQQAMGRLTVSQRYVHLYINGLYWGLYHIFEKPNASYFAEHFGGEPQDYDVLQHQGGTVDGDRDAWNEMFDIARDGLESAVAYQQIQQYVDVPSLIDYLLINFYSGNTDWDHNNWFGGRKREDGAQWQFFTWDAERTFLNVGDDRTAASNRSQPTELHQLLLRNRDYRMLFADHIQRHFFNDGVLTPESVEARWMARADEIELPLVAEAARWGDAKRPSRPYTPGVEWQNELDRLRETYFPRRTDTVLRQLERRGVIPEVAAPRLSQFGGAIDAGFQLLMTAQQGVIYFTTDGNDPRQPGGGLNPAAVAYTKPLVLTSDAGVKARVLMDGVWSALTEATFLTPALPANADSLRISEVHYNPAAPSADEVAAGFIDNNEFEFIELVNIGQAPIDLTEVSFERQNGEGIDFAFLSSDVTRLASGERVVVVENSSAFAARYGAGIRVAGQWSGRLGNGGELLTLAANDELIHSFAYDDVWIPATDGLGFSLEVINVSHEDLGRWSLPGSWQSSRVIGGTPGRDANDLVIGDSNGDGVFDSSDLVQVFKAGEYEDEIVRNSTFADGDWNGDGEFDTRDFVFAFQNGGFVAAALAEEQELAIGMISAQRGVDP